MRWRVPLRLVLVIVPVLMLIAAMLSVLWAARSAAQAEQNVRQGLQVLAGIHAVHAQLAEGASGIRGYLLTRDERFLQPWHRAQQELPQRLQRLRERVIDPVQTRQVEIITRLVEIKLDNLGTLRERARVARETQLLPLLQDNKRVLDDLRAQIRDMERREHQIIAERVALSDQVRERQQIITLIAVLVVLISVASASLLWWRSQRAEQDRRALEAASQARTDTLSRISHELRTPLNAILGFGQLMQRDALSDPSRRNLRHMLDSADHLLHLVDDVLQLTRSAREAEGMRWSRVDMAALLRDAVSFIQAAEQIPVADWHLELPASAWVLADNQRLRQVLLNVLHNAAKFNRPGGQIRIRLAALADSVQLTVEDEGPGIPASRRDQLFQPFERLDSQKPGTGLGLVISRQWMQAMGGDIHCDEPAGKGACFRLHLPRHQEDTPS